jgi:hypothetical protein
MLKVESFYDSLFKKETKESIKKVDIKDIEEKITKLTDNFRDDLVNLIKEHYDN